MATHLKDITHFQKWLQSALDLGTNQNPFKKSKYAEYGSTMDILIFYLFSIGKSLGFITFEY